MSDQNRAFQEMFQAAKAMLAGKSPEELAEKAGVLFDGTAFAIPSMGKTYRVSYPDYMCRELPLDWHYLVILHGLNLADGAPVTGEAMPMAEMPGGLVRGTKYDHTIAQALSVFLQGKSEAQVWEILRQLGGESVQGKAELCVRLPFLPRVPLYLNIWFADEEFPPSARLLVDRCAEHYLTIEDMVTVGEVVLHLLNGNE